MRNLKKYEEDAYRELFGLNQFVAEKALEVVKTKKKPENIFSDLLETLVDGFQKFKDMIRKM